MSQNSYQLINLTANIVLSWPSSFGNGPVVYDINDVTTMNNDFTITMPNATLVPNGTSAIFNNISGYSFDILANNGITLITSVATGVVYEIYIYDNSTPNGAWRVTASGGGASSITTFTAESSDNSITITNGIVTAPNGTVDFQLPTSLFNLNAIDSTGFPVITGDDPQTWTTRGITAGDNISIINGNGLDGNPIINVSPSLSNLTSIEVGDFILSGSSLITGNPNSSLVFSSNGSGTLTFNGVTIDSSSNVSTINNLTVNGSFNNPLVPKAWCIFTDAMIGSTNNLIIVHNQANVASVTGGSGQYTINFTTPLNTKNYGVLVTVGTDINGELPYVAYGFSIYTAQTTTSCEISVVDASGQYVLQALSGITVQILSAI